MFIFLLILQVIVSAALVVIVLMQTSKGDAVGGMLGGMATQAFGGQGASEFLRKWTKIIALVWFLLCILLAMTVKRANASKSKKSKVIESIKEKAQSNKNTLETETPENLNTIPEVNAIQDSAKKN